MLRAVFTVFLNHPFTRAYFVANKHIHKTSLNFRERDYLSFSDRYASFVAGISLKPAKYGLKQCFSAENFQ